MAVGGTQLTLRKYLGALKDTTTVSLAKVNSDYKVKAFSWSLRVTLKNFTFGHSLCLLLSYHFPLQQELDIAIVKATNHVERPSKEKYIRGRHVKC
jgi:clathrin coat assembly protein AP180